MPTMNRGKYRGENGRYRLPGGMRFNYAVPGGYLEDRVGVWPEQKIKKLTESAEGNLLPLEQ